MAIMDDLYFGRLRYDERPMPKHGEFNRLAGEVIRIEKTIADKLPDDGKALYQEYIDKTSRMECLCSLESFTQGFQLGVKLMVAAIGAGGV